MGSDYSGYAEQMNLRLLDRMIDERNKLRKQRDMLRDALKAVLKLHPLCDVVCDSCNCLVCEAVRQAQAALAAGEGNK